MTSGSPKRRRVVRRGSRVVSDSPDSRSSSRSSSRRNARGNGSASTNRRGDDASAEQGGNRRSQGGRPANGRGGKPGNRNNGDNAGRGNGRRSQDRRAQENHAQERRSQGGNASQSSRPAAQPAQRPSQPAQPSAMADTSTTFADLGLPLPLVNALKQEGIEHPFPIQAKAIPQALDGRDILGRGPTGSGKTFTFGLPIISNLMEGASQLRSPRAVILAPTRELAAQIRARLEPLAGAAGQRVLEVVGGVKISNNIRALARPVDILVATPGRAQDLLDQKQISFNNVRIVALDEADQMADMGFLPQVKKLLNRIPNEAQHLLFSATLDGDVQILVDKYMNDPVTHSTGEAQVRVDSMDHYLTPVQDGPARNSLVVAIGKQSTKTIMFTRTKHGADRMAKKLVKSGVRAVALHGNKGQNSRTQAIDSFTSGDTSVLVATDIAARGIDISGVSLVVHIDVPAEHKAYVHRAGRTARAGTSGTVVTLCFADATDDALALLKKAGVSPTELKPSALIDMLKHMKGRG